MSSTVAPGPGVDPPGFDILPPTAQSNRAGWLLGHVPHSATWIPPDERARLRLTDEALAAELLLITDAHTDRLAAGLRDLGATLLVNRVSRLVVDPERFPDDAAEPMAKAGQGAVYTRTVLGARLRDPDRIERERLLVRWFAPYHGALEGLVASALARWGRCLILDIHSFGSAHEGLSPTATRVRRAVAHALESFR